MLSGESFNTYPYFPTKPTRDTSLVLSSIHSLHLIPIAWVVSYLNAIA